MSIRLVESVSRRHLEHLLGSSDERLSNCLLITIDNPDVEPVKVPDKYMRLSLSFHDVDETCFDIGLTLPTFADAQRCLDFVYSNVSRRIICQCDAGRGRSYATQLALCSIGSNDNKRPDNMFPYNKLWYRLLMEAAGLSVPVEPLVSLVIRQKYPPDRLQLLCLSMQRQRWQNWELIIVTDGPLPYLGRYLPAQYDSRIRVIYTDERKGRWGHPYRQLGIDAARGNYIGLSNDDNYYVPGYFEQMVNKLEYTDSDLVLCNMLHAYNNWAVTESYASARIISTDVGAWLARAELIKKVPWGHDRNDFLSDSHYVEKLAETVGLNKVCYVHKPLFIKN
jgi:hypothetical protein